MRSLCFFIVLLFSVTICKAQEEDRFSELHYFTKFCAKFALDEKPDVRADTNLIAIWKMKEDVDQHNYFVLERHTYNDFVFTYMNRGGANRTYENFSMFFSKIGNMDFLNVALYYRSTHSPGYFFFKVTDMDPAGWSMTLSLVGDTTLKNITSREALKERIVKNIDNPSFYKAPVHFNKILPLMYCK